jgi:pyruvate ferredoxin oxidoreductase alpha subunit
MEFRYAQEEAMTGPTPGVIDEAFAEFEKMFGRKYEQISCFECEDADIILIAMGSMSGTARETVRKLRADGKKVGLAKLTVYRPFPFELMKRLLGHAKVLAVVDRSLSVGYGGPVFADISGAFVNEPKKPIIQSFIIGLGGRDILITDFEDIVSTCEQSIKAGRPKEQVTWVNCNFEPVKGGELDG